MKSKKPNKYAKGEGSVYQRKSDGLWVASLELPSPGPTRRRRVVTAKTLEAVKAKRAALKKDLLNNGDLPTAGQTLAQWMEIWFRDIALKKVRPRTAAGYRTLMGQYIIPAIGSTRLDKLTPAHVRRLESYITSPPPDGRGLGASTAAQAHRVLSVALKYALREGRVTKNVAELTDAPQRSRPKLTVLTVPQAITTLEHALARVDGTVPRMGSRWAAALFTGARQGELLGLEIDRAHDVLDLSWQLQRISWEHGCGGECGEPQGSGCPARTITKPASFDYRYLTGGLWLTRPKSDAGWRVIPLVAPFRAILEHRIFIAQSEPNPFGLVWTADQKRDRQKNLLPLDGSPIDPARDNRAWHLALKDAGIPTHKEVRLHDARHTTASLLLAARVPEKVIMQIMGHSSYVVTRGYQDVDRAQLDQAMEGVSALLAIEH